MIESKELNKFEVLNTDLLNQVNGGRKWINIYAYLKYLGMIDDKKW